MKILLAASLYPPETRGPATFAGQLVEHLEAQGIEVQVVPFREVRWLPPLLRHGWYMLKLLTRATSTRSIVALDPVSTGFPALLAAWLLRVPLFVRVAGDFAWEQGVQRYGVAVTLEEFVQGGIFPWQVRLLRSIERFVASHSRVVVPSKYFRKIVSAWGIPSRQMHVICSAASPLRTSLSRADLRQRVGWGVEPVVFSVGELVVWKGFSALLAAVARLREQYPAIRLIVVGKGPLKEELAVRAAESGLDPQSVFVGELPHRVMRELMSAADIFVLNTNYEGLSHVLLEAMQASVPIVTTPAGGNPELIEDGRTGLLVPFNDISALTRAIRELLTDKKRAALLASAAHKKAAKYVPEIAMAAWEKILRKP